MRTYRLAAATVTALVLAAPAALADPDESAIREAYAAGTIRGLQEFLPQVVRQYPGLVTEIELEEERSSPSGWAYEIQVISGEQVLEIEVDAASGQVVDVDEN